MEIFRSNKDPQDRIKIQASQEETDVLDAVDEDIDLGAQVILWNDDVNTFDHVIETLVEVCGHTPQQAEQCALLVHMKGKCQVFSGSLDECVDKKDKLISRTLTATVEL